MLWPYRLNLYAVQDILLFNNKKDAILFFLTVNVIYWLIAQFSLPVYSHIAIITYIILICGEKLISLTEFITRFLRYRNYDSADDIITLEHCCAFIGVFSYLWKDVVHFVQSSCLNFNLINVSLITFILFSSFIVCYYLGDVLCIWLILHFILLIPYILYHRIGLKTIHFPFAAERELYHAVYDYIRSRSVGNT